MRNRSDKKKDAVIPAKKKTIQFILNHKYTKKGRLQFRLKYEDNSVGYKVHTSVCKDQIKKYHERLRHNISTTWVKEKEALFKKASDLLMTNTTRVPDVERREEQVAELKEKLLNSTAPHSCNLKLYTGYLFCLNVLNGRRDPKNILQICKSL